MIQFDHLTKTYGASAALSGLSFAIAAGEIVGLVGKNGAGKSTALKILSGQLLPSSGRVTVDGISVPDRPREVRARIGYLPEVAPLYRDMTVSAYLYFAGRLRGMSAAALRPRLREVMAETAVTEVAGQRLATLSRGFQQRVGIAQATIHQPPVILLDEPMAGLDPLQIVQIRDLIHALRRRHTVLFSSHILAEITHVCDRVLLIDRGRLRAHGTEEELRRSMAGSGALTLLVGGTQKALAQAVSTVQGAVLERAAQAGKGRVRGWVTAPGDARGALARACVTAGLELLELRAEQGGLEELFLQLLGGGEEGAS